MTNDNTAVALQDDDSTELRPALEQDLVTRIVEAALLAANQPLTIVQLHGLFPLDEPAPEGSIHAALATLQDACADRGVELVEVASGWRFQVKADVHAWVARLWTERQTKYTRATLETLALIAYRQPITRGEIEQIRGVSVNSNIIKALEEREWIRVVGHRDMPGKPELLGTTKGFLDYFGLKRLDELPPLSELKDFGELEPQLKLDGDGRTTVDNISDLDNAGDPDGGENPTMPIGGIATGDGAVDLSDEIEDASETDANAVAETPADDVDISPEDTTTADNDITALADEGDSNGAKDE